MIPKLHYDAKAERWDACTSYDKDTGCVEWSGRLDRDGYGRNGTELAHRYAYRTFVGDIPPGMELDHLWRNRKCVNVHHLDVVTHAENMARTRGPQRQECAQGHPFAGPNLLEIPLPNGAVRRACRACNRARAKKSKQMKQQREAAA